MATNTIVSQDIPVPARRIGTADVVGFGLDGVYFLRNALAAQTIKASSLFAYSTDGWRVERHTRLIGDTTGRKLSDIIGFGDAGVYVARNNGNNTFGAPRLVINNFGTASGWISQRHLRFVADLRRRGYVDIIGFGNAGVYVSKNNGDGTFGSAILALNDFGTVAQGWNMSKHLRFLADVTGDGLPDIVGFGESAVYVAFNRGDGTFYPSHSVLTNFAYNAGGWRIEQHVRLLGDITGDGRPDIVGFGNAGVIVSINNGSGSFQPPRHVLANFGYYAGGWRVEKHPRFLADVNRSGRQSIVGFGDAGVYIALSNGDGTFQPARLVLPDFGYVAGNWRVEKHPRFLVDLTGDGAADIVGFGNSGVYVSYNDGNGNFAPAVRVSGDFGAIGDRWGLDKTIRLVGNLFN